MKIFDTPLPKKKTKKKTPNKHTKKVQRIEEKKFTYRYFETKRVVSLLLFVKNFP